MESTISKFRKSIYFRSRGREAIQSWNELNRSELFPPESLVALQKQALERLLQHSRKNVPYYRDLFRQREISTKDFAARDVLGRLPLIDKNAFRQNFGELTAENKNEYQIRKNSTSGSTGENFSFLTGGPDDLRFCRPLIKLRGRAMCGVNPFAKTASLWGATFDAPTPSMRNKVGGWIQPHLFLSSFQMAADDMKAYAERLKSFRPALLTSYPSPLYSFAQYCKEESIKIPTLRAIIVSAEQLFPHQRKLIEEVFDAPVFNRYGCREFGDIAMECKEHRGLHIFSDRVIVEVVNKNGEPSSPGEAGEIVVTDLDNYAMPFIRYRIGDVGVLSEETCPCGRGLPILKSVEGRVFDLIQTSTGRTISGTFWTLLTRHVSDRITSFQVQQIEQDEIRLLLQTQDGELNEEEEAILRDEVSRRAPELLVTIHYVDHIEPTRSGKRKFVVSL